MTMAGLTEVERLRKQILAKLRRGWSPAATRVNFGLEVEDMNVLLDNKEFRDRVNAILWNAGDAELGRGYGRPNYRARKSPH